MRKRFVIGAVLVLAVAAGPAVYACEQCFPRGSFDPVGNYNYDAKCWSGYSTGYATCIPTGAECDTTTDSTCNAGSSGPGSGIKDKNSAPAAPVQGDCVTDLSGRCSGGIVAVASLG